MNTTRDVPLTPHDLKAVAEALAVLGEKHQPDIADVHTWEARIYIGSCPGYSQTAFDQRSVERAITDFQKSLPREEMVSVRLTRTTYLVGDYREEGWEIGVINYPRFPKSPVDLTRFTLDLARCLLARLRQNRVSVVFPTSTYLLTAPDAQEHPEKTDGKS